MNEPNSRFSRLRQIPPAVWALGFVSLLMDISSEIIHALLPVYLVTVLGVSMLTVGFIEGIAEATASTTDSRGADCSCLADVVRTPSHDLTCASC